MHWPEMLVFFHPCVCRFTYIQHNVHSILIVTCVFQMFVLHQALPYIIRKSKVEQAWTIIASVERKKYHYTRRLYTNSRSQMMMVCNSRKYVFNLDMYAKVNENSKVYMQMTQNPQGNLMWRCPNSHDRYFVDRTRFQRCGFMLALWSSLGFLM